LNQAFGLKEENSRKLIGIFRAETNWEPAPDNLARLIWGVLTSRRSKKDEDQNNCLSRSLKPKRPPSKMQPMLEYKLAKGAYGTPRIPKALLESKSLKKTLDQLIGEGSRGSVPEKANKKTRRRTQRN